MAPIRFFTAVLMILLLVGCSNPAKQQTAGNSKAPASGQEASADPTPPANPAPKQDAGPKDDLPEPTPCTPRAIAGELPAPPAETARPAQSERYVIRAADSCVSYTVREQFAGQNLPTMAVGTTSNLVGEVIIGPDGAIAPSTILFDVRTFKSDSDQRDRFVGNMLSRVDQFPHGEFALSAASETKPRYLQEELPFVLTGDLKVADKANRMELKVTGKLAGNTLTLVGIGRTKMTDHGLQPPNLLGFLRAEDTVQVYFHVIADKQ